MATRIDLNQRDCELLLEVLAYMGRRFFDPEDQLALLRIEELVEGARRAGGRRALRLEVAENLLLQRVLGSYIDELRRPSSAGPNRARIAEIRRIGRRLQGSSGLWSRLLGLFRSR